MTLRQIEIFLALSRTPNMREVATRLFLSQAGVSSALRELETELGIGLFDRVGRGIRLNDKGRLLASQLAPVYQQFHESLDLVLSDAIAGDVRLGASTTLADYVLPPVLYDFKKRHGRVTIAFQAGSTKEIVGRIEDGSLDMGFVEGEVTSIKVRVTPLCTDDLVVVTSNRRLAEGGPYALRELMDENWLLRQEGSGTRETFLHHAMQNGLSPNIFLQLSNNEAIKTVLHQADTLVCISPRVVAAELRHREFFRVPIRDVVFSRLFLQVLHRDRPLSPLLDRVSQAVREALAV